MVEKGPAQNISPILPDGVSVKIDYTDDSKKIYSKIIDQNPFSTNTSAKFDEKGCLSYAFQELTLPFFYNNIYLATQKTLIKIGQNKTTTHLMTVTFEPVVGLTRWATSIGIEKKAQKTIGRIELANLGGNEKRYLMVYLDASNTQYFIQDENGQTIKLSSFEELQKLGIETAALVCDENETRFIVKIDGALIILTMGHQIEKDFFDRMFADNPQPITGDSYSVYWPEYQSSCQECLFCLSIN